MSDSAAQLRLTAIPADRVPEILHRAGARNADAETVEADVTAGAPVNADGTMNLIEYTAWHIREMQRAH